jgi:hypothetical protein
LHVKKVKKLIGHPEAMIPADNEMLIRHYAVGHNLLVHGKELAIIPQQEFSTHSFYRCPKSCHSGDCYGNSGDCGQKSQKKYTEFSLMTMSVIRSDSGGTLRQVYGKHILKSMQLKWQNKCDVS